jgi:hypothetical protein
MNTLPSSGFDPNNPRFDPVPRQHPGFRFAMSVTDSASTARYGLFTARLCRATAGTDGRFTASDCRSPTVEAMTAAVAAAVPSQVDGVRTVDPAKAWATPGAYPLTTITYAVADTSEPADARRDYARLLRYAVGPGQQPGPASGQLPDGYVPLPAAMRTQALAAADRLEKWISPSTAGPGGDPGTGPAAPGPTGAVPAPTGTPDGGARPSAAGSPPASTAASQTTLGNRLGLLRYLLLGALGLGLLGGVAGPVLRLVASRTGRK